MKENDASDDSSSDVSDDSTDNKSNKGMKNIEFINDNIKQLFWHGLENKESLKNKKWMHSILFTFIFAIIVYLLPKYMNKISDFSKNNIIIDNILDLATEDLTQTNVQKKASIFKKLDTIIEQSNELYEPHKPHEPNEPNEPNEPSEPSDQPDELKIIASNILKRYGDSSHQNNNIELRNIKERLKLILEETSTN